jgi:GntR family transcriptional regulator
MVRSRAAKLALEIKPRDGHAKYLQVRDALARAISAGTWKAGDRLPTEDEIVAATGMSLGTVQRAMRMLVDDRVVVRRQGAGTFIASGETPMSAPFLHCRFLNETGATLPIFSRVVRRRAVRARGRWTQYFKRPDIACIERLFSISGEFIVYTHLYFESERFPALASEISTDALTGVNVKDLISRDFHLPLRSFSETLAVRAFPNYVCRAAKIPDMTFGAVLDVVAFDAAGTAVYFQDLFVPPNERVLKVTP